MTATLKEKRIRPKTRSAKNSRKKVNFMINESILTKIEELIPVGERSDFVNQALDEKITKMGREIAFQWFDAVKKKQKKSWTNEEIVKFVRNSRKNELL